MKLIIKEIYWFYWKDNLEIRKWVDIFKSYCFWISLNLKINFFFLKGRYCFEKNIVNKKLKVKIRN